MMKLISNLHKSNFILKWLLFFLVLFVYQSCAPKLTPYKDGPVMSQRDIQKTFEPILQFMDAQPGITFADVGAGSGALTVMMASLMDSATVYIQDIDTVTLNQNNLNTIIDFYSKQSKEDLRSKNAFHMTIGDTRHSNLPNASFDRMYSNATVHVFDSPDSMITDLHQKLKPDGVLFIRDSFKNGHKEGSHCSDPKCAKPLLTIDEFLVMMKRNGFKLVKQSPDMSGYPVFGFAVAD